MRIGLDLDNTLICYDQAFARVGKEEGLLPASFEGNKAEVKRALLAERPDGYLWEACRAWSMADESMPRVLFDGVDGFLRSCRAADTDRHREPQDGIGAHDPLTTDLRVAALRWMENNSSSSQGLGLERNVVTSRAREMRR